MALDGAAGRHGRRADNRGACRPLERARGAGRDSARLLLAMLAGAAVLAPCAWLLPDAALLALTALITFWSIPGPYPAWRADTAHRARPRLARETDERRVASC